MSKQICYVSDEIYPGTMGGIGRLINATAQKLAGAGWRQVFLLAVEPEGVEAFRRFAREQLPHSSVYSVDELLSELSDDELIPLWGFHFSNYWRSYRIALALRVLLRRTRLDGVEFNDYLGLGYVALKWRRLWGEEFEGLPMWVRIHGTSDLWLRADDTLSYSREHLQLLAMERYCMRYADGWIAPCQGTADWFRSVYLREARVLVGTPAFDRRGPGLSHSRRLGQPPYRVLFYAKLQRLKGADLFVKAAVELLETSDLPLHFDLVGHDLQTSWRSGSYHKELERLIPPPWRERFTFHGRIQPAQLETLAKQCVLGVVPSRVETFCLAAHELNWIGLPLVLNDLPAFRDFFRDGLNCRTFDGSSAGLARVLHELLSQPAPFAHWEWNAPQVVASSDEPALYERVLQSFRAPTPPDEGAEQPLVSIMLPFYNMQAFVDATLESIQASSYPNWEAILVDDGSPSAEAQAKFADLERQYRDDPRFVFLRKANGDLASARNFGIPHAKGRYIFPLDTDDTIHPEYIARAVRALNRAPDLAAVTPFVSYFADGQPPEQIIDYAIPYDLHPLLITLENRAGVACSVFRRDVFDRLRYDEELITYEDWDFWWQMQEAGLQVEVLPKILYRYRRRGASIFNMIGGVHFGYLTGKLAERHGAYLERHAGEVYRVYTQAVQELREENAKLRGSTAGKAYLALRRLYHEVRDIRSSTSYRVAQTMRIVAGPIMRRVRGQPDLYARRGSQVLTIEVIPQQNPAAQGNEVWIGGLRPSDSNVYLLSALRAPEGWLVRETGHPFVDKALIATMAGTSLTAQVSGSEFGLLLLHHPWSGQVRLRVGDQQQELDLYAPEAEAGFREYHWTGKTWNVCETLFQNV
jgi:glycosyltransferase involved in cell wall biosynthesis